MKKLIIIIAFALTLGSASMYANPQDLLNNLQSTLSNLTGSSSSSSDSDDDSSSSSSILSAISSFVNNTLANNNFTIEDLVGTWNYSSPAVSFESESVLQDLGGTAAATALESKLEPYYTKLGFDKTTLTVDSEENFTLILGKVKLKGTISKDENDRLVFNVKIAGKSLYKLQANATKSGSTLNVTFDASKLIQILKTVSSVANISTLTTVSNLLSSYDGVYMGFKFTN